MTASRGHREHTPRCSPPTSRSARSDNRRLQMLPCVRAWDYRVITSADVKLDDFGLQLASPRNSSDQARADLLIQSPRARLLGGVRKTSSFLGPPGVGKTHLAISLAATLPRHRTKPGARVYATARLARPHHLARRSQDRHKIQLGRPLRQHPHFALPRSWSSTRSATCTGQPERRGSVDVLL